MLSLGLGQVEVLHRVPDALLYAVPIIMAFKACQQLENIHLNKNDK